MEKQLVPKEKTNVEVTGLSTKIDWKKFTSAEVMSYFQSRLNDLQDEGNKIYLDAVWNERIFSAEISFTPNIGDTYYLYKRTNGTEFLSLISPYEWTPPGEFIGATKSNHIGKWEQLLMDVKSSPPVKEAKIEPDLNHPLRFDCTDCGHNGYNCRC